MYYLLIIVIVIYYIYYLIYFIWYIWLIDGLIDWLIDWFIHWLIDWFIDSLIHSLNDWLINWLIYLFCLFIYLIYFFISFQNWLIVSISWNHSVDSWHSRNRRVPIFVDATPTLVKPSQPKTLRLPCWEHGLTKLTENSRQSLNYCRISGLHKTGRVWCFMMYWWRREKIRAVELTR